MTHNVDRSPIRPEELAEARRYALVIEWSDENNAYLVTAPDLPGMITHGTLARRRRRWERRPPPSGSAPLAPSDGPFPRHTIQRSPHIFVPTRSMPRHGVRRDVLPVSPGLARLRRRERLALVARCGLGL